MALAANVVSTFWYQYHVEYHYSLVAVPRLALGTVYGVAAFQRHAVAVAVAAVGVFALTSAYLWGPLPFSRNELAYWTPDYPVAVQMRELDRGRSRRTRWCRRTTGSPPHLAHREKIYQFPNPFRVVLYGPDISLEGTRLDDRAEDGRVRRAAGRQGAGHEADWDAIKSAFDLVDANESWEVWQPGRPPAPAVAGGVLRLTSTGFVSSPSSRYVRMVDQPAGCSSGELVQIGDANGAAVGALR